MHLIIQLKYLSEKLEKKKKSLLDEMHKADTVTGNFNSSENPLGPAAKHREKRETPRERRKEKKSLSQQVQDTWNSYKPRHIKSQ